MTNGADNQNESARKCCSSRRSRRRRPSWRTCGERRLTLHFLSASGDPARSDRTDAPPSPLLPTCFRAVALSGSTSSTSRYSQTASPRSPLLGQTVGSLQPFAQIFHVVHQQRDVGLAVDALLVQPRQLFLAHRASEHGGSSLFSRDAPAERVRSTRSSLAASRLNGLEQIRLIQQPVVERGRGFFPLPSCRPTPSPAAPAGTGLPVRACLTGFSTRGITSCSVFFKTPPPRP